MNLNSRFLSKVLVAFLIIDDNGNWQGRKRRSMSFWPIADYILHAQD